MTDEQSDRKLPGKPAEIGNFLALKHGANSPRVIEVVASSIRAEVLAQAPWIAEPIFEDALFRYARSEAIARLLSDYLFQVSEDKSPGALPVRIFEGLVSCNNAASRAASDLGLTPLSRAKLAALTTSTEVSAAQLESLGETGKAIRAKRTAVLEAVDADTPDTSEITEHSED